MTSSKPFWDLLHAANYDVVPTALLPPPEGRRAEDFFSLKIRRLRLGLKPRTRVTEASPLTPRPPKPPERGLQTLQISWRQFSFVTSTLYAVLVGLIGGTCSTNGAKTYKKLCRVVARIFGVRDE